MTDTMTRPGVTAALKFSATTEPGIWSNDVPGYVNQNLVTRSVRIMNAREGQPPTLEREGFTLVQDPVGELRLDDPAWLQEHYFPACLSLVQRLTCADFVMPYKDSITVRRASPGEREKASSAPPAEFVHMDQGMESGRADMAAAPPPEMLAKYPHTVVYNVWRTISPPPQDFPLALCDKRGATVATLVEGKTVSPRFPEGIPYITTLHSDALDWYYYPDMVADEAIVFTGLDTQADAFGCFHCAFEDGNAGARAHPRISVEARVLALFAA